MNNLNNIKYYCTKQGGKYDSIVGGAKWKRIQNHTGEGMKK